LADDFLAEVFLDEDFRAVLEAFPADARAEAFLPLEAAPAPPDGRPPLARAASCPPAAATAAPAFMAMPGALSATFFATAGALSATVSATRRTALGARAATFLATPGAVSATFFATAGAFSATFFATTGAFDAAADNACAARSLALLLIVSLLVSPSLSQH
jgi:hypothetical protein